MNIYEISKLLNRDYPLLLIDGVKEIEKNKYCHAFKNLSYNEWFFPKHFPKNPIFPGSLQIEAFTQAVALPLLIGHQIDLNRPVPILLAGVDKVRYYEPVRPGSRFDINVKIDRLAVGIALATVKGTVKEKTVSECKITYKMIDGDNYE